MELIEDVKIEVEESDHKNDERGDTFLMGVSGSVRISDDQFENVTKVFVQAQSGSDTFSLSVAPIAAVETIELIDEEEPKQSAHHKRKEERRAIEEKYEDDHGNLKCDKCAYLAPLKGYDDLESKSSMARRRLDRYHLFRTRIV